MVKQHWHRAVALSNARDVDGLAALLESADDDARLAAAAYLGDTGSKAAVEPLLVALGDRDRKVRAAAAKSLGKVKAEHAIPALIGALERPYWPERAAAAEALGRIGSPAATAALAASLCDRSGMVRRAAVEALAKIDDPAALEALQDLRVRRHRFLFRDVVKTAIEDVQRRQAAREERTLRPLANLRLEALAETFWAWGAALAAVGVAAALFGRVAELLVGWGVAAVLFAAWSFARNKDFIRDKALPQARPLPQAAPVEPALKTMVRKSRQAAVGAMLVAPVLAGLGHLAGGTPLLLAVYAGGRTSYGFTRFGRLIDVVRRERARGQRVFHEPGSAPIDRHRFFVSM